MHCPIKLKIKRTF